MVSEYLRRPKRENQCFDMHQGWVLVPVKVYVRVVFKNIILNIWKDWFCSCQIQESYSSQCSRCTKHIELIKIGADGHLFGMWVTMF